MYKYKYRAFEDFGVFISICYEAVNFVGGNKKIAGGFKFGITKNFNSNQNDMLTLISAKNAL